MTLRYHRGMSLAEFQAMTDEHQRDEAARRGQPAAAEVACDHPFEPAGLQVEAHKHEVGLAVAARYMCPACGRRWAVKRLLPFRKAKVQA